MSQQERAETAAHEPTARARTWNFLPPLLLGLIVLLLNALSQGNLAALALGLALTVYGLIAFLRSTGVQRRGDSDEA